MGINLDTNYNTAIEKLYDIYTDKEFFKQRYHGSEVEKFTFTRYEKSPQQCDLEVRLTVPLKLPGNVPKSVRKLIPKNYPLEYKKRWQRLANGKYKASFEYLAKEHMVTVNGTIELTKINANKTHSLANCQTKCELPMVGQLIANYIEQRIHRELHEDERVIDAMIASHQQ